ncbi:hypothetical protein MKS88_002470 [Plasmodium brasilianum]|uniref:Uncharacterized protein n=2 Tax=Plasmodium (Plasmodium) TaxID=418103 RepID=A0A1A8VYM1_PLAMA|nr:conserved Plasmodium protein, unknown function [Plasmodium malariae]KAI4838958.1 hypothetical protein MKS88_002470 [Plasmodium brasilianum]SBS84807.1 conserved Plasmodium protein, unknown function [Plasmodium malariae]SCN12305.1 conserved Plasmodium protein, unknown function [Plasmodium malariae]
MFRSEAHFLMLANLRFLELQKLLLNRFQTFKNEEIRILKKDKMKEILYEWAKFLTKEKKKTNITSIPQDVLQNKKVIEILKEDIDCKWLVNKINIKTNKRDYKVEEDIQQNATNELKKIDNLHFDEYPELFYYEYPQFPYNYYDKKKMSSFYSLIKFPYNDILNISRRIKSSSSIEDEEVIRWKEHKEEVQQNYDHSIVKKQLNDNLDVTKNEDEDVLQKLPEQQGESVVNYSSSSYIYAPSEMDTSKEKYF